MQRMISVLAFALGFTGVIALASGWSSPAASRADTLIYRTASTQSVAEPSRSRLYVINTAVYPDGLPGNPQDSTFGTLRPDGYRCAVNCDDNP